MIHGCLGQSLLVTASSLQKAKEFEQEETEVTEEDVLSRVEGGGILAAARGGRRLRDRERMAGVML